MFASNLRFLIQCTGKTQRTISKELHITETAFYHWDHGNKPTKNTLKRISKYFSDELKLPYEIFEDGKALLTKQFSEIVSKYPMKEEEIPITQQTLSFNEIAKAILNINDNIGKILKHIEETK